MVSAFTVSKHLRRIATETMSSYGVWLDTTLKGTPSYNLLTMTVQCVFLNKLTDGMEICTGNISIQYKNKHASDYNLYKSTVGISIQNSLCMHCGALCYTLQLAVKPTINWLECATQTTVATNEYLLHNTAIHKVLASVESIQRMGQVVLCIIFKVAGG